MIETSSTYKQKVLQDGREWRVNAIVTTRNGSTLSITNSNILENGLSISDGTSEKGKLCVGSFVSKQLTLKIANFDGVFKEEKFDGATIYLKIGLVLGKNESTGEESVEWIKLGVFYISDHHSAGGIITIIAYDAASKFERKYDSKITYPTTLFNILLDACNNCGVPLYNTSIKVDTLVFMAPSEEAITYASVVSYIAQIAASWARINNNGELVLGWYDMDQFYPDSGDILDGNSSGNDVIDGGTFYPIAPSVDGGTLFDYSQADTIDAGNFTDYSEVDELNGGDFFEYGNYIEDFISGGVFRKNLPTPLTIKSLNSCTIHTSDVKITGVEISTTEWQKQDYMVGSNGYVVSIKQNPYAIDNIDFLAFWIAQKLVDFSFRPMEISALDDPSIEAGDVVYVVDDHGNTYPTIVSNIEYSIGDYEKFSADAESESTKQSVNYDVETKAVQSAKEITISGISTYGAQTFNFVNMSAYAMGLYATKQQAADGSYILYWHDKQVLSSSSNVWKLDENSFTVSIDGGTTWKSIDKSGNIIAYVLNFIAAKVAMSGSYNDLSDKPNIPSATSIDNVLNSTSTNSVQNKVINAALSGKLPVNSPNMTGTPTAPTAAAGTSSTQVATTAFVESALVAAIRNVTSIKYQVVTVLPTTGAAGTIYLLANNGADQNSYDEYIWIGSTYEKLGPKELDLSGYLKATDIIPATDDEINAVLNA